MIKLGLQPKIFCVGLPRTGTTSLHVSLLLQGIASIHRPIGIAYEMLQGRIPKNFFEEYDAFSDFPISIYFRELKELFPEALFILTKRDEAEWLESIEYFFSSRSAPSNKTVLRDMMRLAMFGSITFEKKRFQRIYRQHLLEVESCFQLSPESLLTLDVSDKNAFLKISNFLGLKSINLDFPKVKTPNIGNFDAVDKNHINEVSKQVLEFYKSQSVDIGDILQTSLKRVTD